MDHNLLTVKQAAEKFGVDPQNIAIKVRAGKFLAHKFGREWRINRKSLEAYFLSQSNQPR
jgi:excisionase family DNA binding protein